MALDNPKIDPAIEAQLYGPEPTLANVAPAYGEEPWSWVPTGATDDDEEIRRAMMQHIGSAPPQVGGVPLAAYAGLPPPPPMVPTDIVPPDGAPLPLDAYAGYPAPPPLELAGNPWLAQPPAPLAPPIPYGADLPVVAPGPQLPPGPLPGAAPAMPTEYKPPPFDSGAANPFAQYTPDESYKIAAQLRPEDLLKIDSIQASRKHIEQETALHQAALDNLAAIKQNFADRKAADARTQVKEDQIVADSQALAAKGLDRNRWFRNADTFSAMAAVGGALIGGLMSKPGQPNQGIQFISNIIDKDIEDQKYDIENKRADLNFRQGAVTREFARTGDLAQAAETVRQASYIAVIDEIKTRQQDFDKNGTQYVEYGKGVMDMQAKRAAAQQMWNEKDREYNLKAIKEDRENQLAKSTIAKNRAEAAKLYSDTAKDKKQDQVWEPAQLAALNTVPGQPPPPVPLIKMSQKDYTEWLKTQKISAETVTAIRANDPVERQRELSVPGIVDDQNQPVLFSGKEEVTAAKQAKTRATNMVRKVDNLIKLIEEHGYEPDFAKSQAWQDAQQQYASLLLEAKEMDHLGALSGSDISLEERKIGTSDPTQVRNTIPGLKSFRTDTIEGMNSIIQNSSVVPQGRIAKRWEPAPLDLAPPQKSTDQIQEEKLLEPPRLSVDDEVKAEIDRRKIIVGREGALDFNNPADRDLYQGVLQDVQTNYNPGASIEQQHQIERLGVTAVGTSPEAIKASESLANIASKAKTSALRAMASAALQNAGLASKASGAETPDRSVSFETVPPAPRKGKH